MRPASIYDSIRLAARYADSRPPVHRHVVDVIARRLQELGIPRARRALDVGCGVGLSTAALGPLAHAAVGLEPAQTMLRHHHEVAPRARFVAGRAEDLPFADGSFDLLTAAGSFNYADLALVLPGVGRVLTGRGVLVIYDFSSGRRLAGDPRLDAWFDAFERRYPFPPGYEMDVEGLDFARAGLRLVRFEVLEVSVPMTGEAYLAYAMSETNVEQAIAGGTSEGEIAGWCRAGLRDIFPAAARDVLFDTYIAIAGR
ncbi:MAG TPA: methyltransferase domain-containing protein [Vicinamibacterales bacterium]|nr:methyltransferase domain-containing protein [Vicinamibacterales bacterium]